MLSFELADSAAAAALIDRLERFEIAASLGGVASLVTWPAGVTHVQLDRAEREAAGIADGLLRLAIGIEDPEAPASMLSSPTPPVPPSS